MKIILMSVFLLIFVSSNAQLRKLVIKKNGKEKFAYTIGFPIKILTKIDATIFGNIHIITKDTLYLNIFDKVAISDIKCIEPIIENKISFHKISSVNEGLVGAFISTLALATFQSDLLVDVWVHKNDDLLYKGYDFNYNKLLKKQKRMMKKRWSNEEFVFIAE